MFVPASKYLKFSHYLNFAGCKFSLFLSAIPYTGFVFCMINPYLWSVFTLSALLGAGGGVIWTANGEVCLFVCLFVCVFVCLFVYLFVCLFVC